MRYHAMRDRKDLPQYNLKKMSVNIVENLAIHFASKFTPCAY